MNTKECYLEKLREHVAVIFGCTPKTPTDFNLLASEVFKTTGRSLSVSTLKRIWGYIKADHGTSFSTLSILCRYVGFSDFDVFCGHVDKVNAPDYDSDFDQTDIVLANSIEVGRKILLTWRSEKNCILQKIANPNLFEVVESKNIKLQKGDQGKIDGLAIGHPFLIKECIRNEKALGNYYGAKNTGLSTITIL